MKIVNNPARYEVLIKQYFRSILDISGDIVILRCFNVRERGYGINIFQDIQINQMTFSHKDVKCKQRDRPVRNLFCVNFKDCSC